MAVDSRRGLLLVLVDGFVLGAATESLNVRFTLTRSKGATAFCTAVTSDGYLRLALTVGKRKGAALLHIYDQLSGDGTNFFREHSIPDSALAMAWSGRALAVASKRQYLLVDEESGKTQDVMSLPENSAFRPQLQLVAGGDEILLVTDSLGAFVDLGGRSSRPMLHWAGRPEPLSLAWRQPFVVAALPHQLEVHMADTQELWQTVPIAGEARCFAQQEDPVTLPAVSGGQSGAPAASSNKFYVCTGRSVLRASMLPLESQIKSLMAGGNVRQALQLYDAACTGSPHERFIKRLRMRTTAGYTLLQLLQPERAFRYFALSDVHVEQLIGLALDLPVGFLPPDLPLPYPALGPISSSHLFRSSLEKGEAFRMMSEARQEALITKKVQGFRSSLLRFLLSRRTVTLSSEAGLAARNNAPYRTLGVPQGRGEKPLESQLSLASILPAGTIPDDPKIIDTSIMLLAVLLGDMDTARALLDLPTSPSTQVDLPVAESSLKQGGELDLLGRLYAAHNFPRKALDCWSRIFSGTPGTRTLNNASAGGGPPRTDTSPLDAALRVLRASPDRELVWEFLPPLLKIDPSRAVTVLYPAPEPQVGGTPPPPSRFPLTDTLRLLEKAPPPPFKAMEAFLEHAIELGTIDASLHTRLALLYLDQLDSVLQTDTQSISRLRAKLNQLVSTSQLYDADTVLHRIERRDFLPELVCVFSRLGRHDDVISTLVLRIRDYTAAEQYCELHSKSSPIGSPLFLSLFRLYRQIEKPSDPSADFDCRPGSMHWRLLMNYCKYFDLSAVLAEFPPSTSLSKLKPFFLLSLRTHTHLLREGQVWRALLKNDHLQITSHAIRARSSHIRLGGDSACRVCHKRIANAAFVRYPNGIIAHLSCAKDKNIDPISGVDFRVSSPTK